MLLMHGTGNRFLVLDRLEEACPPAVELPDLARALCDRSTGFSLDGLLVVEPSEQAAGRMHVYNADGSTAEMCGNGLRCVAKLLADRHAAGSEFTIETDAGLRGVSILASEGDSSDVRISLGRPVLDAARTPTTFQDVSHIGGSLSLGAETVTVTCVSMGNPHAVIFVEDPDAVPVERLGPLIESHPAFPNRTNVEFVSVSSPALLRLRVWERGVGETAACGTGAAAAAVAAILAGRVCRNVLIRLRGGELRVEWPRDEDEVFLTGDAVTLGDVPAPDWSSAVRQSPDSPERPRD